MRKQEEDGVIAIKPPELKYGDNVLINDGPFAGLKGIFEKELSGQERVVLLLNAIEYQARAVVDKAFLAMAKRRHKLCVADEQPAFVFFDRRECNPEGRKPAQKKMSKKNFRIRTF